MLDLSAPDARTRSRFVTDPSRFDMAHPRHLAQEPQQASDQRVRVVEQEPRAAPFNPRDAVEDRLLGPR